jgi:hypothetical protein
MSDSRFGTGFDDIVAAERAYEHPDLSEAGAMLSYDERLLLHWATRAGNPSPDAIVDAGCFLGGSTLALAGGVMARDAGPTAPVHAYDLFRYGDESERAWVPHGYDFQMGSSMLPAFRHHVRRVAPLLTVHEGDIRSETWAAGPIGTLFIDVAKSWDTGDAVWRQFFPPLVAGESLVIQQDQVHWGHPWCAIVMDLLADHFEFLGWVWYSSAIYRCVRPVRRSDLPPSLLDALSTDEMLSMIDGLAAKVGEPVAGSVRLSGAAVLASHGDLAGARDRLAEIRGQYSDATLPYISRGFSKLEGWIEDLQSGKETVR